MKKELLDKNKGLRERIKELETNLKAKQQDNQKIAEQGQALQQRAIINNQEILKLMGGIEELKKQIA